MRIHHLDCVSACPLGGGLTDGRSGTGRARLVSHCLLLETDRSLVLVDTGYGLRDVAEPRARLHPTMLALLRPELRAEMTAIRQVQALGFHAHDVRHVVLSHLDFDHAGGLDDFPEATVHLMREEARAALAQDTVLDRVRYRPQQWGNRDRWREHQVDAGETWRGFARTREIEGLGPDVLLVPLPGHTLGHAGVAIRRDADDWLFYAGDAYFHHREMAPRPWCPPGLAAYQTLMEKNRDARLQNQARLRRLARAADGVTVFCAHDVVEYERLAGHPADEIAAPGADRPDLRAEPLRVSGDAATRV